MKPAIRATFLFLILSAFSLAVSGTNVAKADPSETQRRLYYSE